MAAPRGRGRGRGGLGRRWWLGLGVGAAAVAAAGAGARAGPGGPRSWGALRRGEGPGAGRALWSLEGRERSLAELGGAEAGHPLPPRPLPSHWGEHWQAQWHPVKGVDALRLPPVEPELLAGVEAASAAMSGSVGLGSAMGAEAPVVSMPPKPPLVWGRDAPAAEFAGVGATARGTWSRVEPLGGGIVDGRSASGWLWRLVVISPGAVSQQLVFSELRLPPESDLYIYAPIATSNFTSCTDDCKLVLPEEIRVSGAFLSPVIHGDTVVLEYFQPDGAVPGDARNPGIQIDRVVQGYRDIVRTKSGVVDKRGPERMIDKATKAFRQLGESGYCNNDMDCHADGSLHGWPNLDVMKQSVVQILTDGGSRRRAYSAICTGTLLNTPEKKQYVITAYHCLNGQDVSNWAFLFNYERDCDSGRHQPLDHFLHGARLVFKHQESDIILLEVEQPIPTEFDVYYAGWDANPNRPTATGARQRHATIHHPSGDFKKISFDNDPVTTTSCNFCGNTPNSHYLIQAWDDGTTERGSSGSSLLDSNNNVVGVLSGGSAQCPDNNGFDFFGKLSFAWGQGLGDILIGPQVDAFSGRRRVLAKAEQLAESSDSLTMPGKKVDPKSPRIIATPTQMVVREGGPPQQLFVALNKWPKGGTSVKISLSSSRHQLSEINPKEIFFRADDYDASVPVTVTPLEESARDEDAKFEILAEVSSDAADFNFVHTIPFISQVKEEVKGNSIENPIVVDALPFTFSGNTSGPFRNTYRSKCNIGAQSKDVVFKYSPSFDQFLTVDLCRAGTEFDTGLYIMEGSSSEDGQYGIYERWCNDDSPQSASRREIYSTGCSTLQKIPFKAGNEYFIVVDGYAGQSGAFDLSIQLSVQPKSAAFPPPNINAFLRSLSDESDGGKGGEFQVDEILALSEIQALGSGLEQGKLREIYSVINSISVKFPHLVSLETLGYSDHGHPILALSLTGQEAPGTLARSERPRVRVQGGVGGDKKSPFVLLNLLGILANYYGQHEDITETLDRARITFIPVLEPDLQFNPDYPKQKNPSNVSVKKLIDAALTPSGGVFRDEKRWVQKYLKSNSFAISATYFSDGDEILAPRLANTCAEGQDPGRGSKRCIRPGDKRLGLRLAKIYENLLLSREGYERNTRPGEATPHGTAARRFARNSYLVSQAPEIAVGLSVDPASSDESLGVSGGDWEAHTGALLKILQAASLSECGRVVDIDTQQPLPGAVVKYGLSSDGGFLDVLSRVATDGSFCRLLSPPTGRTYTVVKAGADGYKSVKAWEPSMVARPLNRGTIQQTFQDPPASRLPLLELQESSSA